MSPSLEYIRARCSQKIEPKIKSIDPMAELHAEINRCIKQLRQPIADKFRALAAAKKQLVHESQEVEVEVQRLREQEHKLRKLLYKSLTDEQKAQCKADEQRLGYNYHDLVLTY